jgi:hypothetical protein
LRITKLAKLFRQPASDKKRREELLMYASGISAQTGCLNPARKFKDIEEQLRSLGGKSVPLRFVDNVQDGEDVTGLLDDLQEALNDYMVRSWSRPSPTC